MSHWQTVVLNVVSGLALLVGAALFSYNLFSARDEAKVPPTIEVIIR